MPNCPAVRQMRAVSAVNEEGSASLHRSARGHLRLKRPSALHPYQYGAGSSQCNPKQPQSAHGIGCSALVCDPAMPGCLEIACTVGVQLLRKMTLRTRRGKTNIALLLLWRLFAPTNESQLTAYSRNLPLSFARRDPSHLKLNGFDDASTFFGQICIHKPTPFTACRFALPEYQKKISLHTRRRRSGGNCLKKDGGGGAERRAGSA